MNMISLMFAMIVGHCLCDFALQSETMAINKNRNARTELQRHVGWYYWLLSHALIHGGAVGIITGSIWFGIAETVSHFMIDFGKCESYYDIHVDQAAHMVCKVIWALMVIHGGW